jgi:hypothetical protein
VPPPPWRESDLAPFRRAGKDTSDETAARQMSVAGDGLMTDSEWAQFAATKLSRLSRLPRSPSQSPAALGTLTPPESSPAAVSAAPAASSVVVVRHLSEVVALPPVDTTRPDETCSDTECPPSPSPPRKAPRRRSIPKQYTCRTCLNCRDMIRNGGIGKRKKGCMNPDPRWTLAKSVNIEWDGEKWVCGLI